MKRFLSLFVLVVTLTSGVAWAKGQERPGAAKRADCRERAVETAHRLQPAFAQTDADQDGHLSRTEVQTLAVKPDCFRHLDRDHDGRLSVAEIARLS